MYTTINPKNDTCLLPALTLKMHDNTIINVTIVNELIGSPPLDIKTFLKHNQYHDMDAANVHVHGLHVSSIIDDILVKISPEGKVMIYFL